MLGKVGSNNLNSECWGCISVKVSCLEGKSMFVDATSSTSWWFQRSFFGEDKNIF